MPVGLAGRPPRAPLDADHCLYRYALVMERNPLAHAGTATAFVNIGIFLGGGTVQALSKRLYVGSRGDFGMTLQPMPAGSLLAAPLSLSLFYRVRTPVAPSANLAAGWPRVSEHVARLLIGVKP